MDIKKFLQIYDLDAIDKKIGENYWSPIEVAHINDWVVRAAAFKGDFHWHNHAEDDEFFLVAQGAITIDTEKGSIDLKKNQGAVIPKGLQHKPKAAERALVLMFEPARLKSKGD
jgi:mannose-6-phosphate isomerase-like protein (cupin superfamily)